MDNRKEGYWYDFIAVEEAEKEECYLKLLDRHSEQEVVLHVRGEGEINLSYVELVAENKAKKTIIHTEEEIAKAVYRECMRYVNFAKIYVSKKETKNFKFNN